MWHLTHMSSTKGSRIKEEWLKDFKSQGEWAFAANSVFQTGHWCRTHELKVQNCDCMPKTCTRASQKKSQRGGESH